MCRPIGYGFCAVLVWKRVCTLPILVWNGVWFSRELSESECMNVFIVSNPNDLDRKKNMRIRNGFEEFVFLPSNLKARSENGYGFERSRLKTGAENNTFWSEIGSGFGEQGGTPPPRILRSSPPPSAREFSQIRQFVTGNWLIVENYFKGSLLYNLSTLRIPRHATVIHIFPQPINFRITKGECTFTSRRFSTLQLNIMVFCSEHPKRDQNLKFTFLSETTRIPALFIWESLPPSPLPPRPKMHK